MNSTNETDSALHLFKLIYEKNNASEITTDLDNISPSTDGKKHLLHRRLTVLIIMFLTLEHNQISRDDN